VVTERICSGTEQEFGPCGDDVPDCDPSCEPQDCKFGHWSDWAVPLMGCEGLCTRNRRIAQQNNDCGAPCVGRSSETKQCVPASTGCVLVMQDCILNDWQDWTDCVGSPLDQKIRTRKLPHVLKNASNGGLPCKDTITETLPCAEPAIADCTVGDWSEWSTCTTPCGRGLQTRNRTYHPLVHRGSGCSASLTEQTVCNIAECGQTTDCTVGPWGPWSSCSDWRVQERNRAITAASYGGAPCAAVGLNETQWCDPTPPKDCVWDTWSEWSDCTKTCDGGQRSRDRSFMQPMNGGTCAGDTSVVQACGVEPCFAPSEVDCKLGEWSDWTDCTVTCGTGYRSKQIKNYTKSRQDGASCKGSMAKAEACTMPACPAVDCVWDDWTPYGSCTASCGGGRMTRTRAIKDHPLNGGKSCLETPITEVAGCNTDSCEADCRDGTWAVWNAWGACSASCGSGYQSRSRDPATSPNHCGFPAAGPVVQFQRCAGLPECATDQDCKLSDWSDWAACTATCFGVKYKYRAVQLNAKGNGKQCDESALTLAAPCDPGTGEKASPFCGKSLAVADCQLSDWRDWDSCSATCGGGQKKRFRTIKSPPQNGGAQCEPVLAETTGCNVAECSGEECVDCTLNEWSEWGQCHGSQSYRTRSVHTPRNHCGKDCAAEEALEETKACEMPKWESFCAWTEWTTWPTCKSDACPDDVIRRSRSLSFHNSSFASGNYLFKVVDNSDAQCFGTQTQTQQCPDISSCKATACKPVNCVLDEWTDWDNSMGAGLCSRARGIKTPNNACGAPCGAQDMQETKTCPISHDAIDCVLSDWSVWTSCSSPEALRYRSRYVSQNPVNGGAPCGQSLKETQSCSKLEPASDCKFANWGPWSACDTAGSGDATCGTGFHERHRSVSSSATFGGAPCTGALAQVAKCESKPCNNEDTTNCELEAWGDWSTCQTNLQVVRTRQMKRETNGGFPCTGHLQDTKGCAPEAVDCELADWSAWSLCSSDCAGGRRTRMRTIAKQPLLGGKDCDADAPLEQSEGCLTTACATAQDCTFLEWAPWSACSRSCGFVGSQTRTRSYTPRLIDGDGCIGSTSEMRSCPDLPICNKTDCKWGSWTEWSDCSRTCGSGQSFRQRQIAQAPFGYGAKTCDVSNMTETMPCENDPCSSPGCTDGEWSDWEDWEACTATCGDGVTWRSRIIAKQASHCGKPPVGSSSQFATCHSDKHCPKDVDCKFGGWSDWQACTSTCDGVKRRSREVETYLVGNGKPCDDVTEEIKPCEDAQNAQACPTMGVPIDCIFSDWTTWTLCPKTCGGGQQHSAREIKEFARNGGKACDSKDFEYGATYKTQGCALKACEEAKLIQDCEFSDWRDWSDCNICGGERYRTRNISKQSMNGGAACNHTTAEEVGRCPTYCGDKVFCEWSNWGDWASCSVTCKPTLTGKQTGRRHRSRHLKASVVKAGSSRLYEDGDADLQVQELYRRAKQVEAKRWEEVCAAFVVGCLSIMVVAAAAIGIGRFAAPRTTRRLTSSRQREGRSLHGIDEEEDLAAELDPHGSALE